MGGGLVGVTGGWQPSCAFCVHCVLYCTVGDKPNSLNAATALRGTARTRPDRDILNNVSHYCPLSHPALVARLDDSADKIFRPTRYTFLDVILQLSIVIPSSFTSTLPFNHTCYAPHFAASQVPVMENVPRHINLPPYPCYRVQPHMCPVPSPLSPSVVRYTKRLPDICAQYRDF